MRSEKIIFASKDYIILEVLDNHYNLSDLKGDCYNPIANPFIPIDILAEEERKFENQVNDDGVFGYVLEKWDKNVGKGWIEVDSCYGFVGNYKDNEHYIVDEYKNTITESKE